MTKFRRKIALFGKAADGCARPLLAEVAHQPRLT